MSKLHIQERLASLDLNTLDRLASAGLEISKHEDALSTLSMGETWKDIHDLLKNPGENGEELSDPDVIEDLHSVVKESKLAGEMFVQASDLLKTALDNMHLDRIGAPGEMGESNNHSFDLNDQNPSVRSAEGKRLLQQANGIMMDALNPGRKGMEKDLQELLDGVNHEKIAEAYKDSGAAEHGGVDAHKDGGNALGRMQGDIGSETKEFYEDLTGGKDMALGGLKGKSSSSSGGGSGTSSGKSADEIVANLDKAIGASEGKQKTIGLNNNESSNQVNVNVAATESELKEDADPANDIDNVDKHNSTSHDQNVSSDNLNDNVNNNMNSDDELGSDGHYSDNEDDEYSDNEEDDHDGVEGQGDYKKALNSAADVDQDDDDDDGVRFPNQNDMEDLPGSEQAGGEIGKKFL